MGRKSKWGIVLSLSSIISALRMNLVTYLGLSISLLQVPCFAAAGTANEWLHGFGASAHVIKQKAWHVAEGDQVALVDQAGKLTLVVLAANHIVAETVIYARDAADSVCYDEENQVSCSDFELDLAPYKISSTQTAIGVRFNQTDTYIAGETNSEYLALYVIRGKGLSKVLETAMKMQEEQRGPNDAIVSSCVLSPIKTSTQGHFDMAKTCHIVFSSLILDDDSGRDPKERNQTKRTRIRWSGERYVEPKQ